MDETDARRMLSSSTDDDFVVTLKAVLKSNRCGGNLSISDAACLSGLSTRTLQRRLAAAGHSFSDLLDQVRVQVASELLKNTEASVSEVAQQVGYTSQPNFCRAFKRWTGMTPGEFRRG